MNTAARIEAFLEMLSAERGASENTLAAYRRDLEDAAMFLSDEPGGFASASAARIRSWLDDIAARGFAATSQARKLSAARQFFKFLYAEGLRTDDPTGIIEAPKKERPLPKTMRENAVTRLLERAEAEKMQAAEGPARMGAARMHALVETLYATGLRVTELVSLPVKVALRDERFFLVRGKGGKERMAPLSARARAALKEWLALRGAEPRRSRSPPSLSVLPASRPPPRPGFPAAPDSGVLPPGKQTMTSGFSLRVSGVA